jgi:hypothetical protein
MASEVSVVFQVSAVDLSNRNRYGGVGIGTRLQAGRLGVGIPAGARDFSFRQKVQTVSGDGFLHSWYRGFLPVCGSGAGKIQTTSLSSTEAKNAFAAWAGTVLSLRFVTLL